MPFSLQPDKKAIPADNAKTVITLIKFSYLKFK